MKKNNNTKKGFEVGSNLVLRLLRGEEGVGRLRAYGPELLRFQRPRPAPGTKAAEPYMSVPDIP
eukprot:543182-Rhodomonas_salina.1